MKLPVVAIVGQPNTGKSSLFNRIINRRQAITTSEAGTTRDRIFATVENKKLEYLLVDTGGIVSHSDDAIFDEDIKKQVALAVEDADIIVFTIDIKKSELDNNDRYVAEYLRKNAAADKKVYVVLTKADSINQNFDHLYELYEFGFGDPILVSALHNFGVESLQESICNELLEAGFKKMPKQEESRYPNMAVVGKPNAGKSSLINALLEEDRLVVSDIPGTTVDATDSLVEHEGKTYNFIDTAGIRRRGKIEKGIEKFSVIRCLQAVHRADIVLFVMDASEPISKQDQHIAGQIADEKKGLIIVANKWDLKEKGEEPRKAFLADLRYRFPFIAWASMVFLSSKTGRGLKQLFPHVERILEERQKRITTGQMNQFLREVVGRHMPTGTTRYIPKMYYVSQVETNPPHFIFFVNHKKAFHFSYRRYIENRLREEFGFDGTGIKVEFRERNEDKEKK